MKITCSKCQTPLEKNRIGKQRYCKTCHALNMKKNRPKHSSLSEEQKKKANARSYLNVYIKRGKVIKQNCHECNSPITEGHHEDYNKPLDVIWLCRECHWKLHN